MHGDGEIVIGGKQSGAAGHDAVPVVIRVAGEGDAEAILEVDQVGHGIRRGRVHADLAVPIKRHEAE